MMKTLSFALVAAGIVLSQVASADAPAAGVVAAPCGVNTLKGSYAIAGTAIIPAPDVTTAPNPIGTSFPVVFQSITTFDGRGNGRTINETSVIGGAVDLGGTAEVFFTVNQNCTGELRIFSHHQSGDRNLTADIVLIDGGRKFVFVFKDTGVTGSGTGERIN